MNILFILILISLTLVLLMILIDNIINKKRRKKEYENRKKIEERIYSKNEEYLKNSPQNLPTQNINLEIPPIETPNNQENYNYQYQENYNYQYQEINQEQKQEKICPYERKLLLTKNEWSFYKKLKNITDKYNLYILSKVRMEDVIRVKDGLSYSETQSARGRIKSRHIDFIIAEPKNLKILIAIELDDNSHRYRKAKEADTFKNEVFTAVGLPYIRTYGYDNIEEKICKILNIESSPRA